MFVGVDSGMILSHEIEWLKIHTGKEIFTQTLWNNNVYKVLKGESCMQ